jgi:hypothetical protein
MMLHKKPGSFSFHMSDYVSHQIRSYMNVGLGRVLGTFGHERQRFC